MKTITYQTDKRHSSVIQKYGNLVVKTWAGLTNFDARYIWKDGENIYYSFVTTQYVLPITRHNYIDDDKYNSLFGTITRCNCSTLSDRFVFRNE